MKQRPKILYPCGCLIHVNGPDDIPGASMNLCRHYCKAHAKKLKAMQAFIRGGAK